MTRFAESYAVWLADYYLLATVLLALALAAAALLKQPAQRLMVTKSTFAALLLLAILCALPGWSVIHLLAADQSPPPAISLPEEAVEHFDLGNRPYATQSNTITRPEPPAAAPQLASDELPEPIKPKMSWPALLATAHLAGMACIIAWLTLGWAASLRLRQSAQAAPTNLAAILNELAAINGPGSNASRLFTHDRLDVAVALGVLRPMILLPERWTKTQSHERLRAVLAHESTHILNHDLQWVAAARALLIALWANPLFWLIKRRLRLDQEALADAAAAEISSRQQYAEQLVAWARNVSSRPALHLSSAVGLWEGPSQLRQRIAILLDEQLTVIRNCSRRWRIAAAMIAICIATALSMVTLQPPQRAEANSPMPADGNDALPESLEKLTDIFDIPYQQPTEGTRKLTAAIPASAWGHPVNGLRAAIVLESPPVDKFNNLNYVVVVENVSGQDIRFSASIHSTLGFNAIELIGPDGKRITRQPANITTMYADPPRLLRFRLKPNERIPIAPLSAQLVRLDRNGHPVDPPRDFTTDSFKAKPGQYSVAVTADFGPSIASVDPVTKIRKVLSPKPGEWMGQLQTGTVQVALFEDTKSNKQPSQIVAQAEPAEQPKTTLIPAAAQPQAVEEEPAVDPPRDPLFELYRKHFKQPEPNVIAGVVVDERFQPLTKAQVSLYRFDLRDSIQKLIAEKSTDADGKVRFDKVLDLPKEFPGGKLPPLADIGDELLQVTVRAPGRVTHSHLQARQMIAMRGDAIMAMMPPAATLRGRVTSPDAKPVAGALVSVGTNGFGPSATQTDADGNYAINDVPPFDLKTRAKEEEAIRSGKAAPMNAFRASPQFLTLKVVHPDFAVAQGQVEKTPGTMDVQLQPAAILVGRVVFGDSGKPAGGARIVLAGHDQWLTGTKPTDDEQRRFVPPFYTASVRADAGGNYRLASLPTGYYHLTADLPGWVNAGLRDIEATPGKTNTAPDLTLTKGGTIAIRLVDAKTREPIGVPLEAEALIGNNERPIYDRPPTQRMVPSTKNGLFELQLPAGKHEIYIGGVYVGQVTKWMSDYSTAAESPNAFVTVTDSQTVQVDMPVADAKTAKVVRADIIETLPKLPKLPPRTENHPGNAPNDQSKQMSMPQLHPNVASGRVVDEKRQPLTGAEVLLFRINQRDGTRKFVAKKISDANGQYRFDNVIDFDKEFPGKKFPGSYEVGDEMLGEIVRAPGRITTAPLLMPQEVAKSGDYQEVKMLPAATLRGRVTDASGKPVAGALVSMDSGPNAPWEEVQASRTDANGDYKIDDAAGFDEAEFNKQVAEQEQQRKTEEAGGAQTYRMFVRQPILRVDHPDFAVKRTTVDKSPGTKDVQLQPAAVLEGRVVFADSGKPAAGVLVGIVTSVEQHDPPIAPPLTDRHELYVRTDAGGKYHAGSLPPGKYELWAATPDWVNVSTNDVVAAAGKTSVVPDLKFTKGGTVSARIVDGKSRKPIPLPKDARVMMLAWKASERPSLRRQDAPFITVNPQGRFDVQLTPGKKKIGAGGVEVDGDMQYSGQATVETSVVEGKTTEVDLPVELLQPPSNPNAAPKQGSSTGNRKRRGSLQNGAQIQLVQNTTPAAEKTEPKRPPGILGYGDDKPDGKKSIGGSGEMIEFELPKGVTKIKGIRIHGSRYGLPQAPKEDFEIMFLNEKRDETLHSEAGPYRLFNRGKEQWVRVAFKDEVELPRKFWVCLNFNAAATKGVYVSYDTSTKGKYSRVGLPGANEEPKETDFKGDWMVQLILAKPEK